MNDTGVLFGQFGIEPPDDDPCKISKVYNLRFLARRFSKTKYFTHIGNLWLTQFRPLEHNLNKPGRDPPDNVTYKIS